MTDNAKPCTLSEWDHKVLALCGVPHQCEMNMPQTAWREKQGKGHTQAQRDLKARKLAEAEALASDG